MRKFNNKDGELTPEQLREKTLKKMQEQQAKAQKEQEKWEKKQRDKKAKAAETPNENADMSIFSPSGVKTVEVDSDFDNKGRRLPQSVPKGGVETNRSNSVEFDGVKTKRVKDSTVEFNRTDTENRPQKEIQRTNDGNSELLDNGTPKKRGFFERMFGKKKETDSDFKTADNGDQVKVGVNSKLDTHDAGRPNAAMHDTVMHRVETEIARRRLQDETASHSSSASSAQPEAPPDDSKGEVVDLNSNGAPAGPPVADVVPVPPSPKESEPKALPAVAAIEGVHTEPKKPGEPNADPDGTAPATEADIKFAVESQYRDGLKSKDVVAREAAFQRAAVEHRVDAIPFLLEEIHENRILAPYAPQYLAGIGKLNDDVELALIKGLTSGEGGMRRSCAEALGYLKARHAVQPLIAAIKTEKSYSCRSAYAQALGLIGDRIAIPPLKLMLEDRGEVEFVRSRVALALANLGDPSGRAHLVTMLDSRLPAMQVMALSGLAQLRDPEMAGYLNAALESPYDEVWVTGMTLMPSLGVANALPMMRVRLESTNETLRRRAALVMGLLGSDDALPLIERAVRVGSLQERIMGCELIAKLLRTDKIPLLIEKLQDPHTLVRQAAAVSLVHLKATEAIPALIDAGRGQKAAFDLPPALRGGQADATERLTMLSCVRTLRGEQGDIFLSTLPSTIDQSWPEVDRVLSDQTVEFLKMYELVDVIPDSNQPVGAVLKSPDGKELLVREGEAVTAGFRVRDMALPTTGKDKQKLPGYVTLMRGEQTIRLIIGHPAEVDTKAAK